MTSSQSFAAIGNKNNTAINAELDADLRRMPRMNPHMQRTIHNIFSALIANVEIEWPAHCDPGPMAQRDMLLDVYTQLCTHGIVGGVLNIERSRDPTRHALHAPLFSGVNRFVGCFHHMHTNTIEWKPDEPDDAFANVAVFVHRFPYEDATIGANTREVNMNTVTRMFDGWLSLYLDVEIQMRSMSNSAFRSFIRSSEGFLRRHLDIDKMLKSMPESRMSKEVDTFLAETQDLRGAVALPSEYRAQMSFAKRAAADNAPNTPGWPHDRILPPGMEEEITMPTQISTGILSEMREELYINIVEMQHHAASTVRHVVEAALIFFYNAFFRPDRYAYYVMLEARRQVESVCQFVERKIEFDDVSYWLILPDVADDEQALLDAVHAPYQREDDDHVTTNMNPYLQHVTPVSYAATKLRKRPALVAPKPYISKNQVTRKRPTPVGESQLTNEHELECIDIRASRVLRNALAPFIVEAPKHPQTAGVVPTFKWPPVKNILPEDEKPNGGKRPSSTSSTIH